MKIVDIGTAYQLENDWFIRVMLGPFKSEEEADEFGLLVALLEPEEETPPALGINVSETINATDKFGG